MLCGPEMRVSVLVLGGIATANVPARHAHAKLREDVAE
jgi:hypothetical protein